MRTNTERLRAIQRHLKVDADGELGPQTLTAIEHALSLVTAPVSRPGPLGLQLSMRGVIAIVRFEIGSDANYERQLKTPCWPGGDSGVTIGIGYDLGYQSEATFRQDWDDLLSASDSDRLAAVCGKKQHTARIALAPLADISISLNDARRAFTRTLLPRYAKLTKSAFPGLHELPPDAQAALVSVVFNRGASMRGDTRREMRDIREQVREADLAAIAASITSMKRLWEGRNLAGLLKRRDVEAELVLNAKRSYSPGELIGI